MANPWFRMYSEFSDDPKVQMMPEAMQRRLVMLFCSKCKGETLHETELAFHWRISETELVETKSLFLQKEFIDEDWNLLNWNKRQFLSDSSTDRVRKHRQAKKQDETLQETTVTEVEQGEVVTVTPPEQNRTDTEHKKSQRGKRAGDVVDLPIWLPRNEWNAYLEIRRGKRGVVETEHALKGIISQLEKFRTDGLDPLAILNTSIQNSWTGVFAPKHGAMQMAAAQPKRVYINQEAS